jgi:17beta-estradiol 17-dehydrogenase / very-long-chain 3-oxoacyl-CoA reductase
MAPPHPCDFGDIEVFGSTHIDDLVNCNCISMTKMTSIVLPGMVKKRKGIIINNCAGAGRHPLPSVTLYSATKGYVDFFSRLE